jgi:citrate lyase subunit beta / citryl-CoA lyase
MKLRRTTVFIPGIMAEDQMRDMIATCGTDLICLDLEDTVVPARKAEAREMVVRLLNADVWGCAVRAVQINAVPSAFADDDIGIVVSGAGRRLDTLLMSKPENAAESLRVDGIITENALSKPIGYIVGIEFARAPKTLKVEL